ncbi:low choriolytic enzyme-like [Cottoperca gobio]|uniref:Metalloendopeptidase n=1 Tax=Cottoperca gobio TaxID=56716 RepID=A0A6J2RXC3_COTGO|nr:low choriolytic enzyme-like [Cottoperca gobio]
MILQVAALSVLFCSIHSSPIQASFEKIEESSGNTIDDDSLTVSALIEKANANLGKNFDEPLVMFGDIIVPTGLGNADPCTARGCLWPKATDGNVYVPFCISNQFSQNQRNTIIRGLDSFAQSTCIRFFPRDNQRDFVDVQSLSGCFSYVGRIGKGQVVSLNNRGCVVQRVIQHEMLHALGFDHEQTRSDRDQNVRIVMENIIPGRESNFRKINTRNLGTPYDYNSVMHYDRLAFSRNGLPTIIPIPDENASIGEASQMSTIDILRVNRLYDCNSTASRANLKPVQRKYFPQK